MNTQLRYSGYKNTEQLWHNKLLDVTQCDIINQKDIEIIKPTKFLRLGQLVEYFLFSEMKTNSDIEIIGQNIQVIENKITIGELDCLILDNHKPVHIEIVYKFYLYDESLTGNEIDKWIGPNRNDSLKHKLTKLKYKQLPLLHHSKTSEIINSLGFKSELFDQRVHFKGQLFTPLNFNKNKIKLLNKKCIQGTYITLNELHLYTGCSFYIPNKLDWLVKPHNEVNWISFEDCQTYVKTQHLKKRSVLVWIKTKISIEKCFIVFWN